MTVSINGTSGLIFNDASSQNTSAFTGGFAFRNRLINSDMRIDQRNAGASVTPTDGQYLVDRWSARQTTASKFSAQQNSGSVTPPAGFTNYLGAVSLSAYSVSASDIFSVRQKIEGFNVSDLGWGSASAATVTLSFWVRSSLTGTFGGALYNSASTRSYPFSYTISAANTWELETITIAGDTSGTWLTTNGTGIEVNFGLGVGSTYSGTAGAWAGTDYRSATGATSVVGTNGATFYVTGVQLEKGSTATSFDYRPYGTEFMLCQRYYQQISPTETQYTSAGRYGANIIAFSIPTVVSLRAAPTVASSGNFTLAGNGASEAFASPSFANWSTALVTLSKSGLTHNPSVSQAYTVSIPATGTNYVSFSSEL
jgi:hypothetical protein